MCSVSLSREVCCVQCSQCAVYWSVLVSSALVLYKGVQWPDVYNWCGNCPSAICSMFAISYLVTPPCTQARTVNTTKTIMERVQFWLSHSACLKYRHVLFIHSDQVDKTCPSTLIWALKRDAGNPLSNTVKVKNSISYILNMRWPDRVLLTTVALNDCYVAMVVSRPLLVYCMLRQCLKQLYSMYFI